MNYSTEKSKKRFDIFSTDTTTLGTYFGILSYTFFILCLSLQKGISLKYVPIHKHVSQYYFVFSNIYALLIDKSVDANWRDHKNRISTSIIKKLMSSDVLELQTTVSPWGHHSLYKEWKNVYDKQSTVVLFFDHLIEFCRMETKKMS